MARLPQERPRDKLRALTTNAPPPKTIVLLFDTSLSMQWDKLERSYAALERILHSLKPADRFKLKLLLFNTEISRFQPSPAAPDPASHEPQFFSGNLVSLSRVLSALDSESIVIRDSPAKTFQTVTYRWK